MKRREFLRITSAGMGSLAIPIVGRAVPLTEAITPIPNGDKKKLADAALNVAKSKGAIYADVRIGRYLNQFVITREEKVLNIVNTQSYGAGVRVIANGTWGFAATNEVTTDQLAKAAGQAVAIAKANAKLQQEPVQLAPAPLYGEVTWKTPIEKNAFSIPVSEKVDLLMAVNSAAMKNGANFVNSSLFLVNEQKSFASTEGSYIDQDTHRIWPNFTVTVILAKTRNDLARQRFARAPK